MPLQDMLVEYNRFKILFHEVQNWQILILEFLKWWIGNYNHLTCPNEHKRNSCSHFKTFIANILPAPKKNISHPALISINYLWIDITKQYLDVSHKSNFFHFHSFVDGIWVYL